MKYIYLILFFIALNTNVSYSQGTKFFEGSWKDALELSKEKHKLIFVDAYTTWCKPCRRMKNEILPAKKVGKFMNQNFINLSIDVNTWNGLVFSLFYDVRSYPSYFYIDPNGKIIHKESGFKSEKVFIRMGEFALKRYDNTDELDKKWDTGNQNYSSLLKYVIALNKQDKPSEEIVKDFLIKHKLRGNSKARLIFDAINTSTGELFQMMIEDKNWMILNRIKNGEKIYDKLYYIFKKDIKKAIFTKNKSQLKYIFKSLEKIKILPIDEFSIIKDLYIADRKKKFKTYKKTIVKLFNQTHNSALKQEIIKDLYLKDIKGKSLKLTSFELAKQNYNNTKSEKNLVLFIKILILNNKYDEATALMQKASETMSDKSYLKLRRYRKFLRNTKK